LLLKSLGRRIQQYESDYSSMEMLRPTTTTRAGVRPLTSSIELLSPQSNYCQIMEFQGVGVHILMSAKTALELGCPFHHSLFHLHALSRRAHSSPLAASSRTMSTAATLSYRACMHAFIPCLWPTYLHFMHVTKVFEDPMTFNPDRLIVQTGKPAARSLRICLQLRTPVGIGTYVYTCAPSYADPPSSSACPCNQIAQAISYIFGVTASLSSSPGTSSAAALATVTVVFTAPRHP